MNPAFKRYVILLENPKYGGNIGMVCRLIANFGFEPLRIVGKPNDWEMDMEWMAYGSKEEIDKIQYFPHIGSACSDLDILIGTSMNHHYKEKDISLPKCKDFEKEKRIGIIFGREDNGLSLETKEHCDYLIDFHLPGYQKSMNVSQSVAYVMGSLLEDNEKEEISIHQEDIAFKKRFYDRAQKVFGLLDMNDFHGSEYLAVNRFRYIIEKANIRESDYNFLHKMFQQIENLNQKNIPSDH